MFPSTASFYHNRMTLISNILPAAEVVQMRCPLVRVTQRQKESEIENGERL